MRLRQLIQTENLPLQPLRSILDPDGRSKRYCLLQPNGRQMVVRVSTRHNATVLRRDLNLVTARAIFRGFDDIR